MRIILTAIVAALALIMFWVGRAPSTANAHLAAAPSEAPSPSKKFVGKPPTISPAIAPANAMGGTPKLELSEDLGDLPDAFKASKEYTPVAIQRYRDFVAQAKLTPDQQQQMLGLFYDARENLRNAWDDPLNKNAEIKRDIVANGRRDSQGRVWISRHDAEDLRAANEPAGGPGLFVKTAPAVTEEARVRASKFLDRLQLQKWDNVYEHLFAWDAAALPLRQSSAP